MAGGRVLIEGPPRRVQTHTLHGAAARAQGDSVDRWVSGVTWRSDLCGDTGGVLVPSCDSYETEGTPDKLPPGTFGTSTYDPFIVWAGASCTTATRDEVERAVRDTLMVDRHRQLEAEFWRGNIAIAEGNDNPYLSRVDLVDELNSGDATPLAYALADLQQAIASCAPGGRGMIHATVRTVSLWHLLGMIRVDGTSLVDVLGNIVVPGVGYDGSAPGGAVDATGRTAWAYATGLVVAEFGDELGLAAIDRQTNDRQVIVEEFAGAWFDECCLFGVNVDLCNTECSTSGS